MNDENEKIYLPTNIKQIGSISDSFRIYIEDYALTYIHQYAKECGCEEKNAVLLGEDYVMDGSRVIFISGVIQGKYSEIKNGMDVLTEKSWQYINDEKEKYFNGLKILGWVYVQPGYGDYINDFHVNYHLNHFGKENDVLFIVDPIENISSFFKSEESKLKQVGGYIVYYDKNQSMQDYMIENRVVKISTENEKPDGFRSTKFSRPNEEKADYADLHIKPRTNRLRGKLVAEQRKMVNLFGSMSAVLFLVCFIMGAGLVQNDDRIRKIESQLAEIDNSYQFLLNQVGSEKTQNVFAQQTEPQKNSETETQTSTDSQPASQPVKASEPPAPQTSQAQGSPAKTYKNYTVKKGDSLGIICRKNYGNEERMDEILEINGITDPDVIQIGDIIKLP